MNKAIALCTQYRKWLIVLAVLAGIALTVAVVRAAVPVAKTVAEPPAETEVTFDLDSNKVYSADDGVIVIPAGEPPTAAPATENPAVQPIAARITDSPHDIWQQVAVVGSSDYTLPEQAQLSDGSIGALSIPKLGLPPEFAPPRSTYYITIWRSAFRWST